jgi:hypothetical protein
VENHKLKKYKAGSTLKNQLMGFIISKPRVKIASIAEEQLQYILC